MKPKVCTCEGKHIISGDEKIGACCIDGRVTRSCDCTSCWRIRLYRMTYGQQIRAERRRPYELVEATFAGDAVRQKRVYYGERALSMCANEKYDLISAHSTVEEAWRFLADVDGDLYPVQLVAVAKVIGSKTTGNHFRRE